jgi:hypothetical protein
MGVDAIVLVGSEKVLRYDIKLKTVFVFLGVFYILSYLLVFLFWKQKTKDKQQEFFNKKLTFIKD